MISEAPYIDGSGFSCRQWMLTPPVITPPGVPCLPCSLINNKVICRIKFENCALVFFLFNNHEFVSNIHR